MAHQWPHYVLAGSVVVTGSPQLVAADTLNEAVSVQLRALRANRNNLVAALATVDLKYGGGSVYRSPVSLNSYAKHRALPFIELAPGLVLELWIEGATLGDLVTVRVEGSHHV